MVQVSKSFDVDGRWRRASEYELVEGFIITPTLQAKISSYDPWEMFRKQEHGYRTVERPYIPLLELSKTISDLGKKMPVSERFQLDPRQGIAISTLHVSEPPVSSGPLVLEWVTKYGLLGLLPVLSDYIALAPKIGQSSSNPVWLELTQRRYTKNGGSWVLADVQYSGRSVSALDLVRRLYKNELRPRFRLFDPGLSPGAHRWFYADADFEYLPNYFPRLRRKVTSYIARTGILRVKKSFQLPLPNSDEFWPVYGEPINEFVLWADLFRGAVQSLSAPDPPIKSQEDDEWKDHSYRLLSMLAASASLSFQRQPQTGAIAEERKSAGLLASYSLMFLWDLMKGRRVLPCRNCNAYFVSNERKARYCSPRCQNTAHVRRERQKRKKRV